MTPALALVTADSNAVKPRARGRARQVETPEVPADVGPSERVQVDRTAPRTGVGGLAAPDAIAPAEERRLITSAQQGNTDAFGMLVRSHQRRAYAVARAIAVNHEDAEDAVQEGFLHAYRALDRFLLGQPFGAWLHRIIANAALDLTRRRRVREADSLPDNLATQFRDPAEASDLRGRLAEGLAGLSDRQRAVIVLHDVQGFRHGEIGQMLGIPDGTARSDLFHARLTLRHALRSLREVR